MSHCTVPTWHQRQEQVVEAEEANKYPHVHNHFLPMSSKCEEVAEVRWEKGQLGMQGLGGILSISQAKQTLGRAGIHCIHRASSYTPREESDQFKIMTKMIRSEIRM
ncbi:hypothetical protein HAX54_027003 [Datura stramonium]|uniref:Uncharacterized protein n=1 Tax=Datura stramonium TaxID=4076 RepID=A0ABS8S8E7_DATST|nr:hypothetical protein [Datura stramonium]